MIAEDLAGGGTRNAALVHYTEDHKGAVIREGLDWRDLDQFFIYGKTLFYYKPQLSFLLTDEVPPSPGPTRDAYNRVLLIAGTSVTRTLDYIRTMLKVRHEAPGLPHYRTSTPNFYKFDNVCSTKLSISDLTPMLLQRIKVRFSGRYNPLLTTTLFNSLYEHNGELYCTDLRMFLINPTAKLGVFHNDGASVTFYPFAPLTAEQEQFVQDFALVDAGYGTPANIIYL